MAELRAFIDQVRSEFGVPYPLADQRPFASGKELLSVSRDAAGLDPGLCLVATVRGQYVLTPAEIEAVRSNGARMVNLASDEATDRFTQMEVIMCQWRRISSLLNEKGLFIYAATRTSMRGLEL